MRASLSLGWLIAILGLPGCAAAQEHREPDIAVRRVERVEFFSPITDASVTRYASVLRAESVVEIQSPGGNLSAALVMAEATRRAGARFHVVGAYGQCRDECALVWLVAEDRIGPDFVPVFFDGGTLPWTQAISFLPASATPREQSDVTAAAEGWDRLLAEKGIAPWLHTCAWRLRNVRFDAYPHGWPIERERVRDRVRIAADFDAVWFPKEVLEAAGVRGLEPYDPPSREQRLRHSPSGEGGRPGRILWAEADACDEERT